MDLSGAAGASFVPLDEHGQPEAVVRRGEIPGPAPEAWLEYLASPLIRASCQQCSERGQYLQVCPILNGPLIDIKGVYCIPLKLAGEEFGILILFQPDMLRFEGNTQDALAVILDTTTLALKVNRLVQREEQIFHQLHSIQVGANPDQSLLQFKVMLEERTRLGREIHDGLAQTLGFLKLQVAQMQNLLDRQEYERLRKNMRSCYRALSEAYVDAREAIDNLRIIPGDEPECRLQDWLQQTVRAFQEDLSTQAMKIHLECEELPVQVSPEVHAQLIRIIQEGLSNVRKHAQATMIEIQCVKVDGDLVIEVRDDGCGFLAEEVPRPLQHGLRGMKERAELIGADYQVISHPGNGTIIRIRLPVTMAKWVES